MAGIDLEDHVELFAGSGEDVSRRAFKLREHIKRYQDSFTAVERVCYGHYIGTANEISP